jgi:hypothetical protein
MTDLHYLPVSLGEAMDKLSILDIKLDKITDSRRDNVQIEYDLLYKMLEKDLNKYNLFYKILKIINIEIWDMMNLLRDAEEYNHEYMVLCRECMISNDIRFRIKNKINYISNCSLKEQKGYKIMRILFNTRNDNIVLEELFKPIKYYSFLYDEIIIITNKENEKLFEKEFGYDPTIKIMQYLDEIKTYKKVFDLTKFQVYSIENIYNYLEINNKIIDNYFVNF